MPSKQHVHHWQQNLDQLLHYCLHGHICNPVNLDRCKAHFAHFHSSLNGHGLHDCIHDNLPSKQRCYQWKLYRDELLDHRLDGDVRIPDDNYCKPKHFACWTNIASYHSSCAQDGHSVQQHCGDCHKLWP
jgi:hypothetical protein